MTVVALLVIAYVLGSIPTGYWVVKATKGVDLLEVGSGSTGTTNVLRNAGKGAAAFVFAIDIFKGFLPVWLAIYTWHKGLLGLSEQAAPWIPFLVAIIALVGHSKSIFLNFRGGKSAATGLGTMLAMNWLAALCAFAVFLTVLSLGRIVSIASILGVSSSAIFMWFINGPPVSYTAFCALGAAYVVLRHKENIKRILSGTEPKIGQKLEN